MVIVSSVFVFIVHWGAHVAPLREPISYSLKLWRVASREQCHNVHIFWWRHTHWSLSTRTRSCFTRSETSLIMARLSYVDQMATCRNISNYYYSLIIMQNYMILLYHVCVNFEKYTNCIYDKLFEVLLYVCIIDWLQCCYIQHSYYIYIFCDKYSITLANV